MTEHGLQEEKYPRDLAEFILPFLECGGSDAVLSSPATPGFEMPTCETLKKIISCAYQASLQTEEQRGVTFRLIFARPEALTNQASPGLNCFEYVDPLPFDSFELRKLSAAAAYHRSLIGVCPDAQGLSIWGIVHSGPRWLKALQGGRADVPDMPPALVFRVTGPGRIEVAVASRTIDVSQVARAIDLEADTVAIESIRRGGTRHRSVYRFCNAIPDATAQVISQDGNVRFVNWRNNAVTYWDHQAIADSFD